MTAPKKGDKRPILPSRTEYTMSDAMYDSVTPKPKGHRLKVKDGGFMDEDYDKDGIPLRTYIDKLEDADKKPPLPKRAEASARKSTRIKKK